MPKRITKLADRLIIHIEEKAIGPIPERSLTSTLFVKLEISFYGPVLQRILKLFSVLRRV